MSRCWGTPLLAHSTRWCPSWSICRRRCMRPAPSQLPSRALDPRTMRWSAMELRLNRSQRVSGSDLATAPRSSSPDPRRLGPRIRHEQSAGKRCTLGADTNIHGEAGGLGKDCTMAERLALAVIPGAGWSAAETQAIAREAEAAGFDAIFAAEVNTDVMATAQLMGAATSRIQVGTW